MDQLAIGETARRAGVRASTLRYYESVGLLDAPARVGGRRRYDPVVLTRLAIIRLAQDAGFSIDEIRTLLLGFEPQTPATERWQALAQHKLAEVDAMIARALRMRALLEQLLGCACTELEECATIAG